MHMSRKSLLLASASSLLAIFASGALAADVLEPPVIELPEPTPIAHPAPTGGWYLRGDVGYSWMNNIEAEYVTAGPPIGFGLLRGDLSDSYFVGGGVGYDTGHYLRFDSTLDYTARSNFLGSSSGTCNPVVAGPPIPCTTTDTTSVTLLTLLANAYVDVELTHGFKAYAGAGIGGTYVKWGTLLNDFDQTVVTNDDELHGGYADWRFTYALHAGASYDVTNCLALDAGYRFRRIEGGAMFGVGTGGTTGPGFDSKITTHDFKVGARYKLAGLSGGCGAVHIPDYTPEYTPVYK
jgi:opacity protein-like surface antigen